MGTGRRCKGGTRGGFTGDVAGHCDEVAVCAECGSDLKMRPRGAGPVCGKIFSTMLQSWSRAYWPHSGVPVSKDSRRHGFPDRPVSGRNEPSFFTGIGWTEPEVTGKIRDLSGNMVFGFMVLGPRLWIGNFDLI
jgi:hypothetical protein